LVEWSAASTFNGIQVDDKGNNAKFGCVIEGNIIRRAAMGIRTVNTFGFASISGNHVDDWVQRGYEAGGTGTVSLTGNTFRQSTQNNSGSTRYGIQMGTGTTAIGNTVIMTSGVDGGTNADFLIKLSSGAQQVIIGNILDAGSVTSPSVPTVTANGATGADARILFNSFLNGATLSVSNLVRPVAFLNTGLASITGTNYLGFYGTTPAIKPTVSGSRGSNAALADLLTELATLGLITDSSS